MKRNGGPGYREADCTKRIHSYGTVYELLEHSGFIDMRAESIYFNRRECPDAVIGSRVSFCAREGPKGLNAVSIRLESGFSDRVRTRQNVKKNSKQGGPRFWVHSQILALPYSNHPAIWQ